MFEFRISFSALIYLGGSNFGVRILILANYLSSVRISNFFFCRQFMIFYFYSVALRAASILKNLNFLYLFNVLKVAKDLYLGGFEHREYVRTLSFEKCCRMH